MSQDSPSALQRSWPAIGTTAVLRVSDPAQLAPAVELLRTELARIDRAASSWREDSELSRLLARGGGTHAVSEILHEALGAAIGAAEASDGLVDPTLGRGPAWSQITLSDWAVHLPAGVTLDLGATGKALCADRAVRVIARRCPDTGVLVSLGGDIAVSGPAPAGGWAVHVTDDHRSDPTSPGQTVRLHGGALATSSITVRGSADGTHHILDPRSGRSPVGPWRTVSVTAATCVDANTASTAAIVLGDAAPDWLEAHGLAARLVALDGGVVTVGGWPAADPVPAWGPAQTVTGGGAAASFEEGSARGLVEAVR